MKLVRYGAVGQEKPGLVDRDGGIRDLSAHVSDIGGEWLAPEKLAALAAIPADSLPLVENVGRLGTPFAGTRQFIAIGLNYSDHAAEAGMAAPTEPIVFTKAVSCLQGPNDDVRKPRNSTKMDWAAGTRAKVAPLSVGPWLVTADEVGDPQDLGMWLNVNGKRMQDGNTRTMIFSCAHLVSYVSQFMELQPGDIITTGTPPGVGMGQTPPVFLNEGDVIELGIDKLGSQKHTVRAWNHGK